MIDDRIDLLIRRLDVGADPDRQFVETSLARLLPAARDARRFDASPIGRLGAAVPWGRHARVSRRRPVSLLVMVALAAALLLATLGLAVVGSGLLRLRDVAPSITYSGSFEPVDLGSAPPVNGVAVRGGRVLFLGDLNPALNPTRNVRVWDPVSGKFATTGMLRSARSDPTFVSLRDGRVLVLGGDVTAATDGAGWSSLPATAEVFDPVSGTSQAVGPLVARRTMFATALLPDGRVLISGGYDPTKAGNPEAAATAEIFDPATGTFTATGSMRTARGAHTSLTLPDGRVLVFGGVTGNWGGAPRGNAEAPLEIFDPAAGVFSPAASVGDTSSGFAAVVLADGHVLVIHNGCDDRDDHPTPAGHHVANVEFYDPASGLYRAAGQLPNCVDTATALPTGEVLVTGFWWDLAARHDQSGGGKFRPGQAGEEMLIGWSALFDPDTGEVRETAPIVNDRARTILLSDGKVLFLDFRGPSLFR
jgi:hypothetical protein